MKGKTKRTFLFTSLILFAAFFMVLLQNRVYAAEPGTAATGTDPATETGAAETAESIPALYIEKSKATKVSQIFFTTDSLYMKSGSNRLIEYSLAPENAQDQEVTWNSSNKKVANNKNVGTATCVITGKGCYTGTKKINFKILPKKTSLKKVTPDQKSFTVTWAKQDMKMSNSRITGYEILYSTKSDFSSSKFIYFLNLNILKTLSSRRSMGISPESTASRTAAKASS